MAFEQDAGIDIINLSDGCTIDIGNEVVQEEMEVKPASCTCMVVMIYSNSKEIVHFRFHLLEQVKRIRFRDGRNCCTMFTDLKDVQIVIRKIYEVLAPC